jgi:hypothetical protein
VTVRIIAKPGQDGGEGGRDEDAEGDERDGQDHRDARAHVVGHPAAEQVRPCRDGAEQPDIEDDRDVLVLPMAACEARLEGPPEGLELRPAKEPRSREQQKRERQGEERPRLERGERDHTCRRVGVRDHHG